MTGNWTAIVINYNGAGFIEACIQALESCSTRPAEIIVIDNGSTDDSLLEMHAFPRVQVFPQGRNLGFAGGANAGLAIVETDYAVILNPDVEVSPSFGARLAEAFDANARLAAAGPLLLYPGGEIVQHAGGVVERPLMTTRHHLYGERLDNVNLSERPVDFVTGGAMALRMDAVRDVGGFDADLSPVYYEDVDLCFRLRKQGWEVKFIPALRAVHYEGVTLQRSATYYHHLHRNRIKFALKHLSSDEWAGMFVPSEMERIRNELLHQRHAEWLTVSGANAIEGLFRTTSGWDAPDVLRGEGYAEVQSALDDAQGLWEARADSSSSSSFSALLRNLIMIFSPRHAIREQRAFNAAIVRAIQAQDRLHREQLATTLLLALDVLYHQQNTTDLQTRPPDPTQTGT